MIIAHSPRQSRSLKLLGEAVFKGECFLLRRHHFDHILLVKRPSSHFLSGGFGRFSDIKFVCQVVVSSRFLCFLLVDVPSYVRKRVNWLVSHAGVCVLHGNAIVIVLDEMILLDWPLVIKRKDFPSFICMVGPQVLIVNFILGHYVLD